MAEPFLVHPAICRLEQKKACRYLPDGGFIAIIYRSNSAPRRGQEGTYTMIEVTDSASKAIKAFMEERQLSSALRVFLQSGG
jgi:hypothetical protein